MHNNKYVIAILNRKDQNIKRADGNNSIEAKSQSDLAKQIISS
ncbi:hypothetical protein [Clostridium botulinum]|nr:hypothetical protein [Clostridium botulinum]